MAYLRTCHNCAHDRDACAKRDQIRRAISGHSVTSVKFRCDDRLPLYRPGDRVSVAWPVPRDDGYDEYDLETWPATVIKEVGARFVIRVDDVDSDHETPARSYIKSDSLYCKVSPSKLTKLDEPQRRVCGLCGIVGDNGFNECWQMGSVPHSLCLRAITDRAKASS